MSPGSCTLNRECRVRVTPILVLSPKAPHGLLQDRFLREELPTLDFLADEIDEIVVERNVHQPKPPYPEPKLADHTTQFTPIEAGLAKPTTFGRRR